MKLRSDVVRKLHILKPSFHKVKESTMPNGIVFIDNWGFYTNNLFLVRARHSDRGTDFPIFFSLEKEELEDIDNLEFSMQKRKGSQEILSDFPNFNDYHKYFFDIKEYSIHINRQELRNQLDSAFGRSERERLLASLVCKIDFNRVNCKIMRISKRDRNKEFEFEIDRVQTSRIVGDSGDGGCFAVNCSMLHDILKVFDTDIIKICFNTGMPVVITDEKSIHVALAQSVPKYM